MNTTPDLDHERDPPDDDTLAGELVLGVLDAPSRRAAQARIAAEPAFAARVLAWERRLGSLVAQVEPVPVPAHAWTRVRARLGWIDEAERRGWWNSLAFWRGLSLVGLAATAALAVFVLRQSDPLPPPVPTPIVVTPPPAAPGPVVTLASDAGSPAFLTTVDRKAGHLRVVPVPVAADAEGRVPELWLIPPGQAPISLGVIDHAWTHEIDVPENHRWALGEGVGSLLAVSLEPAGGAPGGAPTGPIVAKAGI